MPIWFNWIPLTPLIEKYQDDGTRDLSKNTIVVQDVGTFEVSLVGTPIRAELIRIATLDSDGNLTPKQVDVVDKLADHCVALLKLTADAEYERVRFGEAIAGLGAHDVDGKPSLSVSMTPMGGADGSIGSAFQNALSASIQHRSLMMLLADAATPALPLQYRYLSLYKILELEFRTANQWDGLDAVLDRYAERYAALQISNRSLRNIIHEVRDKCAHLKVGGSDRIGLLGLSGEDVRLVRQLIDLLHVIVGDHINKKEIGIKIVSTPMQPELQYGDS